MDAKKRQGKRRLTKLRHRTVDVNEVVFDMRDFERVIRDTFTNWVDPNTGQKIAQWKNLTMVLPGRLSKKKNAIADVSELERVVNAKIAAWRDPTNGYNLAEYEAIGKMVPVQLNFGEDLTHYADDARQALEKQLKSHADGGCPASKEFQDKAAKARAAVESAVNLNIALQSLIKTLVALREHGMAVMLSGNAPTSHVMSINIVTAQVVHAFVCKECLR